VIDGASQHQQLIERRQVQKLNWRYRPTPAAGDFLAQ